jgi:hypothetical protein
MSDQHYSYKPDTTAWIIHEHLPHLPVGVVERLAEDIDALALSLVGEDDDACDGACGYDDGMRDGIADAIAALEAL